jgi:hypothetical protein
MKLKREEFFGHEKIQKLTNQINKRTLSGFVYLSIKEKDIIKLLKDNVDWLDYIGISLEENKEKKTVTIRWRDLK